MRVYPFIKEVPWITTRSLRLNEKYSNRISVSCIEFDRLIKSDNLVLIQDLYGYRYGVKKESLFPDSCTKLTELHPKNLKEAFKINPEIIAIGLITSDFLLLQERLFVLRKTESKVEINKRIAEAENEIKIILQLKELFRSIIEVSRDSEASVFDQVLAILNPYIIFNNKDKER